MNCACVAGADKVLVTEVKSKRVDLHTLHPTAKLKQLVALRNGEDPDDCALRGRRSTSRKFKCYGYNSIGCRNAPNLPLLVSTLYIQSYVQLHTFSDAVASLFPLQLKDTAARGELWAGMAVTESYTHRHADRQTDRQKDGETRE